MRNCQIMLLAPGLLSAAALAAISIAIGDQVAVVSPLIIAVLLGGVIGNTVGFPAPAGPGLHYASSRLLRLGVVLLGLRVSLADVMGIGLAGLVVVGLAFTATFFGAQWLGRRMRVSPNLSLLIGTGYAICGLSAVAAMKGVIDADEEEAAYAVGLVTLAGSLSIVVLPLLAGPLGLANGDFGSWVGGAVHDVAQTVATASTGGDAALAAAVVVKLTRVALLAPLVVAVTVYRRRHQLESSSEQRPPILPLFVGAFLLAVTLRSLGLVPDAVLTFARLVEGFAFTMALVGVGAGVSLSRLRILGGAPLALGMATWAIVAGMSYLGVIITR